MAAGIETGQVSVRLTGPHAKALERYRIALQKKIRGKAPGWNCTTAHAIRDLILRGLLAENLIDEQDLFE